MRDASPSPGLVEQVYSNLLETICTGGLPQGMRLTQEWLAERLQVSRQPVIQALALLKSQGFVCEVGRRGLMVAPLDASVVRAVYAVRGALDKLAAREAATAPRRDAVRRGKAIIANGRKALASRSIARLIAADVEFHGFIYDLSGNSLIGDTMELLWYRLRYAMSAYLRHSDWADETWDEHTAILQAILDRDADRAERLAGAHVDTATVMLQDELTRAETSAESETGRLRPLVVAAGW